MLRFVVLSILIAGCFGSEGEQKVNPPFPDSRIVGGVLADITQHPYQLSLQTTGHICGASVISAQWAITAAHCVGLPANRYTLRAGSSNKDWGTPYGVKEIVVHSNYSSTTTDYDVALLKINGTFKFSRVIQPVSMAGVAPKAGVLVNVTGWGAVREGGQTSSRLMRITVPIVNTTTCEKAYRFLNPITPRMLCAGYTEGGKDSCQGDSGGPLAANGVLYGIVSWGYGCAKPQYPGVYTNVANVRFWIKRVTGL
nr:PREDICTED: trypsin-7-like [Megachile rotundata]